MGRLLARFPDAVINVHPALLPAFPGFDAVGQALAYGVKVFGVSVHFVDEGVDTGPVILQRAIELPDAREPEDVLPRLHEIEHALLPEVVRLIARGEVRIDGGDRRRPVGAVAGKWRHGVPWGYRGGGAIESGQMATETFPTNAEQSLREAAPGEVQIGRALLSVSDKTGIVEFARGSG